MEPTLRVHFEIMRPRLEARRAMFWASVVRVAQTDTNMFRQQMNSWERIANGAVSGQDIDPRGRPIIHSLHEWWAPLRGDYSVLQKYGTGINAWLNEPPTR